MKWLRMRTPLEIEPADDPDLIDIGWMRIVVAPYSRFFWDGCAQGELRLPKCQACGNIWFYPTPHCTRCLAPAGAWIVSSGKATLYSYTGIYRPLHAKLAENLPYIVAVVQLEEGPRLMTNIEDAREDELELGMNLRVRFRKLPNGAALPMFVRAG